ncbi:methyltransferase family protein [Ottowia sp.]|uniref:methyltransferase family protein n=1 Tax=Ottowia sp. TaxID=1898956 RepID=UPI003A89D63D
MARWFEHKIPPPVIDAGCAALMWCLAQTWPTGQLWARAAWPWGWISAIGLAAMGSAVALAGVRAFGRARTTVNPLAPQKASALVTTGIYQFTRNPMYLGMLLVLCGWAVWLGHAAALAVLPLSVMLLNQLQIKPEERILRQRFGQDYARYIARVKRWGLW